MENEQVCSRVSDRKMQLQEGVPLEGRGQRGVILHVYATDGKGHGSRGSRPEGSFEIEVEEVEGE